MGQFQAFTVTFSDTVTSLPDKIYSFGELDGVDLSFTETVTITQEIVGAYFIPNDTPDFEGISLQLEDGSFVRFGMDESYSPSISDFVVFTSRLIGFSAKFGSD